MSKSMLGAYCDCGCRLSEAGEPPSRDGSGRSGPGDRDANVYTRARTARRRDVEAEPIAVSDAWWHRHREPLIRQLVALTAARLARRAPYLATPTTFRTRVQHADLERDHGAKPGLPRRNRDLRAGGSSGAVRLDMITPEENDRRGGRGKIDRHLIDKRPPERAGVRRDGFERER